MRTWFEYQLVGLLLVTLIITLPVRSETASLIEVDRFETGNPTWTANNQHVTHEAPSVLALLEHHVHYQFSKNLENLIWTKSEAGLRFANNTYYHDKLDMDEAHLKHYKFYQMIYALSSGDELYSLCTLELVRNDMRFNIPDLKLWLVDKFNFNTDLAYKAIKFYAKTINNAELAEKYRRVTDLMFVIVEEFNVLEPIFSESDSETLKWLLDSRFNLKKESGYLIAEAWETKKFDIVKEVLARNALRIPVLFEILNNLMWNDTFVDFIVSTQNKETIEYAMEAFETPFELFIRSCLKHNNLEPLRSPYILEGPFDWKMVSERDLFVDIVGRNKLEALQEMMGLGFPLNTTDSEGLTLLYRALEMENTLMLGGILYSGGSLSEVTDCGKTLLHVAVERGALHVVKKLITLGLPLNPKDCQELTPLHTAIMSENIPVIRFMHDRYENGNLSEVREILHFAARNGTPEVIEGLLARNISINELDGKNSTPIDVAMENCRSENAFKLIEHGATFNEDKNSSQYIRTAISCNDTLILKHILENVYNATEVFGDGESVLRFAVRNGNVEVLKLLLEYGLNPNAGITTNLPPIVEAIRNDDVEILTCLKSAGAVLDFPYVTNGLKVSHGLLHEASRQGSEDAVRWLLKNGRPIEEKDPDGNTPLIHAASAGQLGVARILLQQNADAKMRNSAGSSVLHEAAKSGNLFIVRELLVRGADPNGKDQLLQQTPLHWAAHFGHQGILMELLDRGADIESRNEVGDTAIHKAAAEGNYPIVMELLNRGADMYAKNYLGQTALSLAEKFHHERIAKALLFRGADVV